MDRISILFAIVGLVISMLILGGVYADTLNAFLYRRIPQLSFEGDTLLIWGILVMVAFVFGLSVMFVLLYP